MSLTHLLDSDVFSQPMKKIPNQSVVNRWDAHGDSKLAIAAITEGEVLFGLEKNMSAKLTKKYEEILKGRLTVLPVDSDVAASYGKLKADCQRRGKPVAENDLWIAATAHARGLKVATINVRHFENISGIIVEDWSTPLVEMVREREIEELLYRTRPPRRPEGTSPSVIV